MYVVINGDKMCRSVGSLSIEVSIRFVGEQAGGSQWHYAIHLFWGVWLKGAGNSLLGKCVLCHQELDSICHWCLRLLWWFVDVTWKHLASNIHKFWKMYEIYYENKKERFTTDIFVKFAIFREMDRRKFPKLRLHL